MTQNTKPQRKDAQEIVSPAPGYAYHVLPWDWDEIHDAPSSVREIDGPGNSFGAGKYCDPSFIIEFEIANDAAVEIALTCAEQAAAMVATHADEERAPRIAFAAVFTKVYEKALDAGIAELMAEALRQRQAA